MGKFPFALRLFFLTYGGQFDFQHFHQFDYSWQAMEVCIDKYFVSGLRPGSIDPMTTVVQRVKAFAYYSLSFFTTQQD